MPSGYHLHVPLPLAIGDDSEPEPDFAVVSGSPRDYLDAHPDRASLVMEVADTSLGFDRTTKRKAYEAAGIPEYWIVNLNEFPVEVSRNPVQGKYQERMQLRQNGRITLLALPQVRLVLHDFLP